jgi:hypothetical protein
VRFDKPRMREIFFESTQYRIEAFHMADLQYDTVARGQFREVGCMCSIVSDRFLNQDMFTLRKESPGNLVVGIRRCCDGSGVNHSNKFIKRPGWRRTEFVRDCAAPKRLNIVHYGELSGRNLCVQACMITSDMPNANNANAQLFHQSKSSQLLKVSRVNARKSSGASRTCDE